MEQRIMRTVREILMESNMDELTEYKIRKLASDKLSVDLSKPPYKAWVRQVVREYLQEQEEIMQKHNNDQQQDENDDEEEQQVDNDKDYDDEGNLIICKVFFLSHSLFGS